MGASYKDLTPGHEEFIYEGKKANRSGAKIRLELAAGIEGERPISVSASQVNRVGRRILDERDELYSSEVQHKPAPEGLRLLTRRLMLIAERETYRLEKAERAGRLDANKLGRLAGALTKLHTLLERNDELGKGADPPVKKGDSSEDDQADAVPGFAASLTQDNGEQGAPESAPAATSEPVPPPVADRVLHAVP